MTSLLNTAQVAKILNVNASWVHHRRADGRGPDFIRVGKGIRYRVEDVQAYLNKNLTVLNEKAPAA